MRQIMEDDEARMRRVPVGRLFHDLAEENVKRRWVEQGIWRDRWYRRR